ncbi:Crp/Fnr family transcriptional regulator [Desulfoscipio sp. XC116]|uniref:Crp/Fnr family transcriptional regulator n=1 Tax=Desulfoscipio sp. XC116 TaxID=3144975 RepID=UPI00325B99F5
MIKALSRCVLFDGISGMEIERILSATEFQIREFDKNEFICRTDQHSVYVGIIISGCVEVQKVFPSGNTVCIFYKNKGDMFGGAVVFSNSAVFPCDVFSRKKSKILFLHKQSIFELCKMPFFAENLLNLFANGILCYEKRLELFSYSSIQKKIAFYLLNEQRIPGYSLIHLPFTKKTWAEYLNVSRPSLCRELKKLCNDNIIKMNGDKISIINEEALGHLLQL